MSPDAELVVFNVWSVVSGTDNTGKLRQVVLKRMQFQSLKLARLRRSAVPEPHQ